MIIQNTAGGEQKDKKQMVQEITKDKVDVHLRTR